MQIVTEEMDTHRGREFLDYRESLETNLATHSPLHALRDRDPVSMSMGPSDSHSCILFDRLLNSNHRARDHSQGGGATSGNSQEKWFLCMFCYKGFSCPRGWRSTRGSTQGRNTSAVPIVRCASPKVAT